MTPHDALILLGRVNLAAGAGVLAAAALRKPARAWVGARLAYGLWLLPLLAGLAMLLPARSRDLVITPAPRAVASVFHAGVHASLPQAAPVSAPLNPELIVLAAWLAGVVGTILVMIWLQSRFAADVRDGLTGPAVVGVVRPRIVMPSRFEADFDAEERALVLAHERTHIARQDSRLNGLIAAIQCLCWFNPLIHLAARLSRIDQEMACDEEVVTRFPDARQLYAHALVKAQLAIRPLPLGCYWPSGTEHPLLERIAMLNRKAFSPGRRIAGASVLALLCTTATAAAWASQPARIRPIFVAAPAPALISTAAVGSTPSPVAPAPKLVQLASAAPTPLPSPEPQAAPAPKAILPRLPDILGGADANAPVTVKGWVSGVDWVNPSAVLHIQDSAGQETLVNSETPNSLLRIGITRASLASGTPISINGYRSLDGSRIFASPEELYSNGMPLNTQSDGEGPPARAAQRAAACGPQPDFVAQIPASVTDFPQRATLMATAFTDWAKACDAKIAALGQGGVTSYSAISNSVVRSGSGK